jgi:hypothetical protein
VRACARTPAGRSAVRVVRSAGATARTQLMGHRLRAALPAAACAVKAPLDRACLIPAWYRGVSEVLRGPSRSGARGSRRAWRR